MGQTQNVLGEESLSDVVDGQELSNFPGYVESVWNEEYCVFLELPEVKVEKNLMELN